MSLARTGDAKSVENHTTLRTPGFEVCNFEARYLEIEFRLSFYPFSPDFSSTDEPISMIFFLKRSQCPWQKIELESSQSNASSLRNWREAGSEIFRFLILDSEKVLVLGLSSF